MPLYFSDDLPDPAKYIQRRDEMRLKLNLRPRHPRFILEYAFSCLDVHTGEETTVQLAELYPTRESDFPAVGDIITVYDVPVLVTDMDTVSDPMWDTRETKHYISRYCTATVSFIT